MSAGEANKNEWKGEILIGNDLRSVAASKPGRGPVAQHSSDCKQRADDQELSCQRPSQSHHASGMPSSDPKVPASKAMIPVRNRWQ